MNKKIDECLVEKSTAEMMKNRPGYIPVEVIVTGRLNEPNLGKSTSYKFFMHQESRVRHIISSIMEKMSLASDRSLFIFSRKVLLRSSSRI